MGSCWCMIFHRSGPLPRSVKEHLTREQLGSRTRRDKKDLVERGCSHGILIYSQDEPVGWCQYGPSEELPRVDSGRIYSKLSLDSGNRKLWRITCFWVDRKHRNRGVAAAGLKAVLDSIREKGGG